MVACKVEAQSEHVTRCVHVLACSAPTCMLSQCLATKMSASELSGKFVKSALLVGYVVVPLQGYCAVSSMSILFC